VRCSHGVSDLGEERKAFTISNRINITHICARLTTEARDGEAYRWPRNPRCSGATYSNVGPAVVRPSPVGSCINAWA
jgi:hypothetical protein